MSGTAAPCSASRSATPCFTFEAGDALGVTGEQIGQDLDGDVAPQLRIDGLIDVPHATGTEVRGDFVVVEACADHRKGWLILQSRKPGSRPCHSPLELASRIAFRQLMAPLQGADAKGDILSIDIRNP